MLPYLGPEMIEFLLEWFGPRAAEPQATSELSAAPGGNGSTPHWIEQTGALGMDLNPTSIVMMLEGSNHRELWIDSEGQESGIDL
jgi:hypothetical protein